MDLQRVSLQVESVFCNSDFDSTRRSSEMSPASLSGAFSPFPLASTKKKPILPPIRKSLPSVVAFKIAVEDIAELAHNKVLVASTLSCTIGQLSKSLTSVISGNGIDWKAAVRSGGMPSTHSASVAAAATSLGLERGFSDPIFGMSLVFAALVMYDAQGVRQEVGYHAKIMNELLKARDLESKSGTSIKPGKVSSALSDSDRANSFLGKAEIYSLPKSAVSLETLPSLDVVIKEASEISHSRKRPLNELVGHTESQVIVGAFLGFIISLMVNTIT